MNKDPVSPSSTKAAILYQKNNFETAPKRIINKTKVFYGMVWYAGSLVGYCMMETYHQGLALKSSKEMFIFTASECLFMVSMAMSYFYSY